MRCAVLSVISLTTLAPAMRVAHGQDGDPVLSGRNTTEQFSIDVPAPGKLTIESIEQGTGGKSTMELSGERLPPS